jgi:hypothetical protein
MVTYSELSAHRERNRNRRTVVLEGTVEGSDAASDVPLTAGNASVASVERVTFETPYVNGSVLTYNRTASDVEFFNQTDGSAQTEAHTDDTFVAVVTGTDE